MSYRAYPNSTPEFRMYQKTDGATEMQVRYINAPMRYCGKWMPVKTEQEKEIEVK
jgi:hypothetical protein